MLLQKGDFSRLIMAERGRWNERAEAVPFPPGDVYKRQEDYSQIYYEIHTSDGGSTVISAEEYREYISERDPIAFEPLP